VETTVLHTNPPLAEHVSGAERTENRMEQSGDAFQKNDGAERSAERGAETDRGAGITEIGWSAERLFQRSRSAHMLCPLDVYIYHRIYVIAGIISLDGWDAATLSLVQVLMQMILVHTDDSY